MKEQWPRCGHREELFLTAFFDLAQAGMRFDPSYWVKAMVENKTGVERRKLKLSETQAKNIEQRLCQRKQKQ